MANKRFSEIENIETLVSNLLRIANAEETAIQAFPEALPEIRSVLDDIVQEIIQRATRFSKTRFGLHGAPGKIPLEALERYFDGLRTSAETEWVRSQKLAGKQARKARKNADRLAALTRQAAKALMVAAQVKGLWSLEYQSEHGLEPWI